MDKTTFDPGSETSESPLKDPPFRFEGGRGSGRVVDAKGVVVMESSVEIGIYDAAPSPDGQLVLIKGGDAINFILDPAKKGKVQLPQVPPGENMLGFGSWHWIGNRALLGVSGDHALDKNGQPVRHDDNVAQNRLYVFDLSDQQLREVENPAIITQPLFSVVETRPHGHVRLSLSAPPDNTEPDLGWFKIEVTP